MSLYLNRLIVEMVRAPLLEHTFNDGAKCAFGTRLPHNPEADLPLVVARGIAPSTVHAGQLSGATVTVDVYASGEDQAFEVSDFVYHLIATAWRQQTVFEHGWIHDFTCPVEPYEFPDPAVGERVVRYLASYDLLIRS